jgi:hypothetical protein
MEILNCKKLGINTDIHALSGIRAHDPSVRAGEDNTATVIGLKIY